MAATVPIN